MAVQLPLGVRLPDHAGFETFHAGPNAAAVEALRAGAAGAGEPLVHLWGAGERGKTHLLQAVCRAGAERGRAVAYVPLGAEPGWPPSALDGLERLAGVCVDDVDAVAGRCDWEEALFGLVNGLRDAGGFLAVASAPPPAELGLALDDLRSRLAGGLVFGLRALDDEGKLEALRLRARARGIVLPEEAGRYLLRRAPRDMTRLMALLDRLDEASLAAQRRVTIPFIRRCLGWDSE